MGGSPFCSSGIGDKVLNRGQDSSAQQDDIGVERTVEQTLYLPTAPPARGRSNVYVNRNALPLPQARESTLASVARARTRALSLCAKETANP